MNTCRGTAFALLFACFAISGLGSQKPACPPSTVLAPQASNAVDSGVAQIRFSYENPKLQPVKYVLLISEDGSGRYQSEAGNPPSTGTLSGDEIELPTLGQDRAIRISTARREKIFAAARRSKYFNFACDTGDHHLAFQGTKSLEYNGPDGRGSCKYNWSNDKQIDMLTSDFESISLTLEEGARLETEYQHSRLRLDAELELLTRLAQQGQAIELANIAPCLEKIASDDAILHLAQRRARQLLDMAKAE